MREIRLRLTLHENTIFTADASTEGEHAALDYIPGSALHGAIASRLYTDPALDARQRYALLHSGRVRFGDGLPCHGEQPAWPVPLSWHHDKNLDFKENGRLLAERIYNFQHDGERALATQPKQLRNGYVTPGGRYLKPTHEYALKTAIDRESGRAQEAQLFGYDALQAGQSFIATLQWDDGVPDVEATLRRHLDQTLLLGRSRSAEFGRVAVEWLEAPPSALTPAANPSHLTLWLIADMALTDTNGVPTLTPEPAAFGLTDEQARVDWSRTFLRTRRYAPYNAYRGVRDEDRAVLSRGSVICFSHISDEAREALWRRHRAGFGMYREQGLGQVLLDPSLLADTHPHFDSVEVETAEILTPPSHPLLDWLKHQQSRGEPDAQAESARKFGQRLQKRIEQARLIMGLDPHSACGPSASQWSNVYDRARHCPDGEAISDWLFKGASPVARSSASGWSDTCDIRNKQKLNFMDWFKAEIEGKESRQAALWAREARERMQQREGSA